MCPPGVDQTTRSRQQWHVIAPLVRQQYDITDDCARGTSYGTNLKNFLDGNFTWNAFDKLAVRTFAEASVLETLVSKLPGTSADVRASPIESLPNELFAMIFEDEALDRSDRIALGLCSTALWRHCLAYIQATCSMPAWAKTPLICTGTYLTDLPAKIHEIEPGLRSLEDAWHARPGRVYPNGRGLVREPGMAPARQWNWEMISDSRDISEDELDSWISDFDTMAYNMKNDIPLTSKKILRRTLGHLLSASKPKHGSHWLLRNHDTREYVHLKTSLNSAMEQHLHVNGVSWLSLDKALLMRICWNTSHPGDPPIQESILRGQWAGHRFDVVRAESSDCEHGRAGWTDVTAEMVAAAKEWRRHLSSKG